MKDDIRQRVENELADRSFIDDFPDTTNGFELNEIFQDVDDKYEIISYVNEAQHRSVLAYFHAETNEYKIRVKIGLNEFCLTKFFTMDFNIFRNRLQSELKPLVESLENLGGSVNSIIESKHITEWQYGNNLPTNLEGFELFIKPNTMFEFTNGSYVVINYCNFYLNSDFVVYYNMFGDEFSSEAHVNGVPMVIYEFDSKNLNELEDKLKSNLIGQLRDIKHQAEISNNRGD